MKKEPEKFSWLALLPVLATLGFYGLSSSLQQNVFLQFLPQLSAYVGIGLWAKYNGQFLPRFGLQADGLWIGIGWGGVVGLILGICNTLIILWVVPGLGGDISFLKQTPHAQVPTFLMVPWGIMVIALLVEVNFRGFLLGRLATLWTAASESSTFSSDAQKPPRMSAGVATAIGTSSVVFAFDPFLVTTFRHLHWIAVWDGCIWGWMRVRFGNLYVVITAHAVEVIILYLSVKAALT